MIFVDAGPFIAKSAQRDQFHDRAIDYWSTLAGNREPLLTSNLVLSEALTLLARKTEYQWAAETARIVYECGLFTILRPEPADETAALGYFEKYADQHVSFTDCVSFALMRRKGIRRVFTFDRHFVLAGFEAVP